MSQREKLVKRGNQRSRDLYDSKAARNPGPVRVIRYVNGCVHDVFEGRPEQVRRAMNAAPPVPKRKRRAKT